MTHEEQFSESQVEDIQQDDVVEKVDQLLSRHRPRTVEAEEAADPGDAELAVPAGVEFAVPAEIEVAETGPDHDGIPTLTDIVSTPQALTMPKRAALETDPAGDDVILRRLETALETVRTRLHGQIGEDAGQAHLLDQLVAVLKLSLPDAVRSTAAEPSIELAQSGESPRL
ncbi:MAG: hypothetical protein ABI771_09335 [Betaproteobacteria bacterium]